MSTPQTTPMRHVKLGIASAKSLPLTNEYKRLLSDQHHRLTLKHQQDLDLLDDIRGYVKARLSIEKDYTNALQKLAKHHSSHINKKFTLLSQLDNVNQGNEQHKMTSLLNSDGQVGGPSSSNTNSQHSTYDSGGASGAGARSGGEGAKDDESHPSSLYKVWYEHINRLHATSKNRSDQFEQLIMIVDKLKDIRQHKAAIGKKCLETHLKRVQEDLLVSLVEVERAKKLYYEDESQAKKARENEERIKKKRTGLLTKFTDLQAKKEKSSAQREATDIQSTQARNDYIMALAAANAHLNYYYHRDLNDFIQLIDDGVLDHCKIFMATLSESDINSLKDTLQHAQYWSRLINLTGSSQTKYIFLNCEQSKCLRIKQELAFEACNNDPIQRISLEHNADYALQHEIDKWFTWFKKECRNLSQLMHQLDTCQHALAEGKKSIEVNGQTVEDLEPKIIELKQAIRKCEAAKLKAQARLGAIKEGGMQIDEWSDVELEIRADMARAQEQLERAQRLKEMKAANKSLDDSSLMREQTAGGFGDEPSSAGRQATPGVQLQISRNSDDDDDDDDDTQAPGDQSMHNLASVSRSTSNLLQKQQNAMSGYSALTDPSLVWQDDYSSAWGTSTATPAGTGAAAPLQTSIVMSSSYNEQPATTIKSPTSPRPADLDPVADSNDPLGGQVDKQPQQQQIPNANMSIQSSSPLSAIMNGGQHLPQSPYQVGIMSEAYKSDYECDYTRTTGHQACSMRSATSSAEPTAFQNRQSAALNEFGGGGDSPPANIQEQAGAELDEASQQQVDVSHLLNRRVIALYAFEKNNDDDLAFNEDDLLVVTETNPEDTNWIRARLEATGEEGYIPSSYVRLLDESEGQMAPQVQDDQAAGEAWKPLDQQASDAGQLADDPNESSVSYCRAVYDYDPEAGAFDEQDGLPHLALRRGELMRVIDEGADDGWWLVEKEAEVDEQGQRRRGHVPSMLVEEVEPNDPEEALNEDADDEEEDFDEGDVSEREAGLQDEDGELAPAVPPPDFEAPVLTNGQVEDLAGVEVAIVEQDAQTSPRTTAAPEAKTIANTNSLIPTSFIIIEPTPEVESRRFEDDLPEDDTDAASQQTDTQNAQTTAGGNAATSRLGNESEPPSKTTTKELPSSQLSYAVVNEDFVLEAPIRKPYETYHTCEVVEPPGGEASQRASEQEDEHDAALELSPTGSLTDGWPAPPSVVIDSVEAIPRSPDLSFDEGGGAGAAGEQEVSNDTDCSQHSEANASSASEPTRKSIKHTGNVDVSPILRHHAEEFCKQLIEEAILLAPGSRIGPSTSSANVVGENHQTSTKDELDLADCDEDDFDDEEPEDSRRNGKRNYSFDDSA